MIIWSKMPESLGGSTFWLAMVARTSVETVSYFFRELTHFCLAGILQVVAIPTHAERG